MTRLTMETIDDVIELVVDHGAEDLDLRAVRFVDPYALLLLDLLATRSDDRSMRIAWPETPAVRGWMRAMGLFSDIGIARGGSPSPRDLESTLQPIVEIADEDRIGRVVDGFHHRLEERYPLTESSRRALVAIMIELFQNIPHHSNASGEADDARGIAAMQDYEGSIVLAVADDGIGLRGSLGLRPGFEDLSDADALRAILDGGISRFADPGRGGELKRIAAVVRSWDGVFALRSGTALLYFNTEGGDIYDVPEFPGVQLGLRLPRHVFGIETVDP